MTEPYYVQLTESKTIRIHLLKGVKSSLDSSVQYYKIDELHKKRSELIAQLKSKIETLNADFIKLQEILPYKELLTEFTKQEEKKEIQQKKVEKKKVVKSVPKKVPSKKEEPKESSPVDDLNDALADIERRLSELT